MSRRENLAPPCGFTEERKVRLRPPAKHGFVDSIAECDARHLIPDKLAAPAFYLGEATEQRGLTIIDEPLERGIGRLVLSRRAIIVDRAKIVRMCRRGAFVAGVVRATVAHELAHAAVHRAALNRGAHNNAMEEQAEAYASAFLLPRERLEADPALLALQDLYDAGLEITEFHFWERLRAVADRFGVSGSLVAKRLSSLGFLAIQARRKKPRGILPAEGLYISTRVSLDPVAFYAWMAEMGLNLYRLERMADMPILRHHYRRWLRGHKMNSSSYDRLRKEVGVPESVFIKPALRDLRRV